MAGKPRYAVGLDLGGVTTRCTICTIEGYSVCFRGYGEVASQGWSKGRIADTEALAECIRTAVTEAERMASATVEAVVIGMGGATIEGVNSRGLYEFGRPREVVLGDLAYAVELAAKLRLEDDRLLLQVFPQDFTIDGRAGYRNPKGNTCSRLEANVHLITASAHDHQSLLSAVHLAHLAAEETVFEPVAAAYAAVVQQDRSRGVAVIDIGATSTDIVVYDGDALLLASSLTVAGDHFTKDVTQGLKVAYEDAERLKREYGCAILGLTSDNSLIEVPTGDGRAPREASRRLLNDILEARAEELFLMIRTEFARVGMEQSLLEGVVLTGGGARLNGMCDMAERVLNCPARNGLPLGIADWPDELNEPVYTAVAGLAMYSARLKVRNEVKKPTAGLKRLVSR